MIPDSQVILYIIQRHGTGRNDVVKVLLWSCYAAVDIKESMRFNQIERFFSLFAAKGVELQGHVSLRLILLLEVVIIGMGYGSHGL